jgi:hypothetical protein
MATPNTRGSWTLDEALVERWRTSSLNQVFRDEWPDPLAIEYEPFNDQEARPVPPGPYCVYEKTVPVVIGHMTGHDITTYKRENQLQLVTVQFRIHAKSTSTESGKKIARRLAKKVATVFDPHNAFTIYDDAIAVKSRGPDFDTREGEDEWVWVIQYDFTLDGEYQQ